MPEYITHRCCMCPNRENANTICPGIKGTLHPEPTECRFVKAYIDGRGWKYRVMEGLGESNYKARYQKAEKTGDTGWKCMRNLPWRKSFDEAQSDLNALAKDKGWREWENG